MSTFNAIFKAMHTDLGYDMTGIREVYDKSLAQLVTDPELPLKLNSAISTFRLFFSTVENTLRRRGTFADLITVTASDIASKPDVAANSSKVQAMITEAYETLCLYLEEQKKETTSELTAAIHFLCDAYSCIESMCEM